MKGGKSPPPISTAKIVLNRLDTLRILNRKPVLSPSVEFILSAAEGLRIDSAEGSAIQNDRDGS
jgi:hypothetical protein